MTPDELELGALTLDEVLSEIYEAAPAEEADYSRADNRLQAWRNICAHGDTALFSERLARDELDADYVRAKLARVVRRSDAIQPRWVHDSLELLAELKQGIHHHDAAIRDDQPFANVLHPLIAGALMEVDKAAGRSFERWASFPALQDIAKQLWQRVVDLCGLPIYRSFVVWRHDRQVVDTADGPSFECDGAFVDHMRSEGLDALFRANPILLRLLTLVRRQWVETYAEMLCRLDADWPDMTWLGSAIQSDQSSLQGVSYGLSDPHDNGRSVIILKMQDGVRIVYKPKSLNGDDLVAGLISLLRETGFALPIHLPCYLKRVGYGWVQFIESVPCKSRAEVDDYYQRAGAWLGLAWLLSTTDLHMENMIACGANPIPLDFETILQGMALRQPKSVKPEYAGVWEANAFLERSVLAVGLLPGYIRADDRSLLSVGGLEASTSRTRHLLWKNIGTMQLALVVVENDSTIESNLPHYEGHYFSVTTRPEAFQKGFEMLLSFATKHREQILNYLYEAIQLPLAVRRVLRPTRFYYLLLRRLLDHRNMHDSVLWSMQAEFIARLYSWADDNDEPWKLFARERAALLQLDIPIFHLHADRTVAQVGGEDVTNLDIQHGLEVVASRISALDAQTVQAQSRLVAMSLNSNQVIRRPIRAAVEIDRSKLLLADTKRSSRDLAGAVFEQLSAKAFVNGQSACWLGIETLDHEAVNQIVPLGYDLYNGSAGIALFLAAFAVVNQSTSAADLTRRALAAPIAAIHSRDNHKLARSMGIGAGVGLASLVYVLTQVARMLNDQEAQSAADAAIALFDDNIIAQDDRFDLMGGASGACLVLLKLHRMTGSQAALERAIHCAIHLEQNRPESGSLWSSALFKGQGLTGISHGAAGYGLAFSRLYGATGIARYGNLARECLDFETANFDAKRNEWPDLRSHLQRDGANSPIQWCHGATGIGYARLAMLDDGAVPQHVLLNDLRVAADTTLRATRSNNDTLCCGVAGRADFLLEAGRVLQDLALDTYARSLFGALSKEWFETGDARWDTGTCEFNLGLFRGSAGIGYAALRLGNPSLPRVLVWD